MLVSFILFFFFFFCELGPKQEALCLLGKSSTTELQTQILPAVLLNASSILDICVIKSSFKHWKKNALKEEIKDYLTVKRRKWNASELSDFIMSNLLLKLIPLSIYLFIFVSRQGLTMSPQAGLGLTTIPLLHHS